MQHGSPQANLTSWKHVWVETGGRDDSWPFTKYKTAFTWQTTAERQACSTSPRRGPFLGEGEYNTYVSSQNVSSLPSICNSERLPCTFLETKHFEMTINLLANEDERYTVHQKQKWIHFTGSQLWRYPHQHLHLSGFELMLSANHPWLSLEVT